jgi:site-specific recombinase XerD
MSSMPVMRALHDFMVEYLEPQGVADNTIRAYRADIMGVARLVVAAGRSSSDGLTGRELARTAETEVTDGDLDDMSVEDLTPSRLRRAFGGWTATHAVASSRRAHSAWSRFFDHLTEAGVVDGNRMAGVPKATARDAADAVTGRADDVRSLPGDPADVRRRLLEAAATPLPPDRDLVPGTPLHARQRDPRTRVAPDRDPWPERDVALVATFLYTAARLSEVCDLNNGSLTGRPGDLTLTLIGKGSKRRQVAVHRDLEVALDEYRASERWASVASGAGPAPLLVGNDGTRLTPNQVQYRFAKLYRRTGLEEQRSPGALVHALRHTVAVQLVEQGVPTPAVQEFLGHASQDTTMRYVRKVARDQKRILDALD